MAVAGLLAAQTGQYRRGLRLMAAGSRALTPGERPLSVLVDPFDILTAERSRLIAAARAALGGAAFDAAWAEGLAMPVEDAVEYAVESEKRTD